MNRPPSITPAHGLTKASSETKAKPSRAALAVGLLSSVALLAWTGIRIHEALQARNAAAAPNAIEAPAVAESEAATEAPALVRGEAFAWRPSVACEGTLVPARDVDLAFKASGRLSTLRVKVGQLVRQGEVLATLETTEAAAQVRAAEAQVRAAEAQLALAEDAERRTTGMVDAGALPQATGVQVEQQRALALAQVDAARAQLSLARAALSNHTLTAPFTAYVTRVPSGTGAIAAAGMPMFHLSDVTTLKLQGTVSEDDAPLLRVGSDIEVVASGRTVMGKVVAVLASVDPMTRRVPFEAEIANHDEPRLLAGTFVRAKALASEAIDVLRLPASALRPGAQDEIVVVSEGKARARRVVLTTAADGALLVRSGLQADEDVLRAPPSSLIDGAEIASLPGASK